MEESPLANANVKIRPKRIVDPAAPAPNLTYLGRTFAMNSSLASSESLVMVGPTTKPKIIEAPSHPTAEIM